MFSTLLMRTTYTPHVGLHTHGGDFSAPGGYNCAVSAKADSIDWSGLLALFRSGAGVMGRSGLPAVAVAA